MVSLKNVCKDYSGQQVLKNINFELGPGQVHGFLGPNGAGKTTTLNIIAGLLVPSEGEVQLFGSTDLNSQQHRLGVLPEKIPLYGDLRVEQYLTFVAKLRGLENQQLSENLEQVLSDLALQSVRQRIIQNLSKGYRQRVAIAQTLMGNPDLIILDEPTVGLDPHSLVEIRALIKRLAVNHTLIFSSHQLSEVQNVATHISLIQNGELLVSGAIEQVLAAQEGQSCFEIQLAFWQDEFAQLLDSAQSCLKWNRIDAGVEVWLTKAAESQKLLAHLVKQELPVQQIKEKTMDLESFFISLTGRGEADA